MAALPQGDAWKKGDEDDLTLIEDCYCPNCGSTEATTVMLPTKVPMFREIIVMTLTCNDCGFRNSEVNFGGEIQERGHRIALHLQCLSDLDRQLIKSDSASLYIPSLQFEIPPGTQRGSISTIQGILKRAADNLNVTQPDRLRLGDVDNFHRCRQVIDQLRSLGQIIDDEEENENEAEEDSFFQPFDIILDDPSGNAYIENPMAPASDPQMKHIHYYRTAAQDMSLGLQPSKAATEAGIIDEQNPAHKNVANATGANHSVQVDLSLSKKNLKKDDADADHEKTAKEEEEEDDDDDVANEAITFPTTCPNCHAPAETDMCLTDIPHFKEVIIMNLACEHCGYKSNEIKGGGAIPKFGTLISVSIRADDDLAREVLKSDTAGIEIPELELELSEGGLDGLYTTVEGLLNKMHDRLRLANPFGSGDAASMQHTTNDGNGFSDLSPNHERYLQFLSKLQSMANGQILPFTLNITDPLSNSFVGPIPADATALALRAEAEDSRACYDEYIDDQMTITEYQRTAEQDEMLGLLDMKTENYAATTETETEPKTKKEESYYGTDQMEELPDRLRRPDHRGPDHPHSVAKAPVDGDITVMGPGSANFAVPAMHQRGKTEVVKKGEEALSSSIDETKELFMKRLNEEENNNAAAFVSSDVYSGLKDGMVYKMGSKGLGYYTDVNLKELFLSFSSTKEKEELS